MSSYIDDLFEELFGFRPRKKGTSYEMLSAAVCKLLVEDSKVLHDERLRGKFSNTLYQIDVFLEKEDKKYFAETKDYTKRKDKNKVGRDDLQKLAGALRELKVDGGIFFSATDYTEPAKKYAEASKQIIGKNIKLMHLRPSVEQDEQGRIKRIVVTAHIHLPIYEKAVFKPVFTQKGEKQIQDLKAEGKLVEGQIVDVVIDDIFDAYGNVSTTIHELTSSYFGGYMGNNAMGSFRIPHAYILFTNELVEIHGISYNIPFDTTVKEIVVDAKGKPKLLIKDEKGNIDKLITDRKLKKIKFEDNGEIGFREDYV